jgi:hypothetical protein
MNDLTPDQITAALRSIPDVGDELEKVYNEIESDIHDFGGLSMKYYTAQQIKILFTRLAALAIEKQAGDGLLRESQDYIISKGDTYSQTERQMLMDSIAAHFSGAMATCKDCNGTGQINGVSPLGQKYVGPCGCGLPIEEKKEGDKPC